MARVKLSNKKFFVVEKSIINEGCNPRLIEVKTLSGEVIGRKSIWPLGPSSEGILEMVSQDISAEFEFGETKISRQDLDDLFSKYPLAYKWSEFEEEEVLDRKKAFPKLLAQVERLNDERRLAREAKAKEADVAATAVQETWLKWNEPGAEMVWYVNWSGYNRPRVTSRPLHEERKDEAKLVVSIPQGLRPGQCLEFVCHPTAWHKTMGQTLHFLIHAPHEAGQPASLDPLIDWKWNNSQQWWKTDPDAKRAPARGQLFVNGEDVFEPTSEAVKEAEAKAQVAKAERKAFFDKVLTEAIEVGIEQSRAYRIVRKHNVSVLKAVTGLMKLQVDRKAALRVATKGHAWSYAADCLGDEAIQVAKKFDTLATACQVYANMS